MASDAAGAEQHSATPIWVGVPWRAGPGATSLAHQLNFSPLRGLHPWELRVIQYHAVQQHRQDLPESHIRKMIRRVSVPTSNALATSLLEEKIFDALQKGIIIHCFMLCPLSPVSLFQLKT